MPKSGSKTITILIADDEPLARAGIRSLLDKAKDLKILGEAKDSFEVQELVRKLHPNILLLDYQMPGLGAYQLEKWIRENYPETVTLILTAHDRDAYLAEMINSGVLGYLTKNENAERLINAIHVAAEGTVYFSEEQIARAQKWQEDVIKKWERLTDREHEVMQRLALGEDNKKIAESLNISLKTVEFHITKILKKLDMNSRDEVIVWMLKHQPDNPNNVKD